MEQITHPSELPEAALGVLLVRTATRVRDWLTAHEELPPAVGWVLHTPVEPHAVAANPLELPLLSGQLATVEDVAVYAQAWRVAVEPLPVSGYVAARTSFSIARVMVGVEVWARGGAR